MFMKADVEEVFRSSIGIVLDVRCKEEKNSTSSVEFSSSPEIIFTRSGYYSYHASHDTVEVDARKIVLANEGSEHQVTHGEVRDRCTIFLFRPDLLREMEQACWTSSSGVPLSPGDTIHFPSMTLHATTTLDYLHFQISRERSWPADLLRTDVLLLEFLERIFHLLYSGNVRNAPLKVCDSRKMHLENMERAKEYIFRNLENDLSLNEIARNSFMSEFHFSRQFKAFTGRSPYQYLMGIRLKHAALLLRETRLPVTEICFESGFRSIPHFISTFGRHFKTSPSRFRKGDKTLAGSGLS